MSNKNFKNIAVNYGLALGGILIVLQIIEYFLGTFSLGQNPDRNMLLSVFGWIAQIVIPILALIKYKRGEGGFMNFGEGFKLSFTMYVYSALAVIVWLLVYMLVLEPNYIELSLEKAAQQMYETNPDLTEEQAEMGMNMARKFMSPWIITVMALLFSIIIGAVFAAILSAITHKKRPPHMEYDQQDSGNSGDEA